jgi:hypothetical protein
MRAKSKTTFNCSGGSATKTRMSRLSSGTRLCLATLLLFTVLAIVVQSDAARGGATNRTEQWYKGNLHTHSFWSDGDNFPELIAEWYKTNGYNFLAFSDHNNQEGEKWVSIPATNQNRNLALDAYIKRYGTNSIQRKTENGETQVRLKQFKEYQAQIEVPGKFLLMPGEEVSDRHLSAPVHMGAINVREFVKPNGGTSIVEVLNNNVNAVYEQRKRTRQPMFPHINHPNFGWALTAEEMMQVKREQFFEVYNGHPHVHNAGDATHASTERIWDIILTRRLAELNLPVVYGIATDDGHHYHQFQPAQSNPGRGWIMVRAKTLTPASLIDAMEDGEFYASSGVCLKKIQTDRKTYTVEVDAQTDVTYTIQFIGTRKGYNRESEPLRAPSGTPLRVTHRYSDEIGAVLQEVQGTSATYKLQGDEIYVRAKVISSKKLHEAAGNLQKVTSKRKPDAALTEEVQSAWTQPLVTGVK